MAWLQNCPGCGDCGGKWNAVQGYVNWHGRNGFTDTIPACADGCLNGGRKYLVEHLTTNVNKHGTAQVWVWDAGMSVWHLTVGGEDYDGYYDNTTTTNPKSGCQDAEGTDTSSAVTHGADGAGDNCTGETANGTFMIPYDTGPGPAHIRPLDIWGLFEASCGLYGSFGDGFTLYYSSTDGSAADFIASAFPADWTVTMDPMTNTHIGFVARRDLSYTNPDYPPSTAPPTPGPGDPTTVCASTEVHYYISVSKTLSGEHDYKSLYALGVELMENYDLRTTTWHEAMPGCLDTMIWVASDGSTEIPFIHYDDIGCCQGNLAALGTHYEDCVGSEDVIHGYVGDGTFDPLFVQLYWGAFVKFGPIGDSGGLTIQKWAYRMGNYRPYGWQIGNPKTWAYLRQIWTLDGCSGAHTYFCEKETGGENFIICLSPNGEFDSIPNAANFWFEDSYTFTPERTYGNITQLAIKDADADKYPGDCHADPPTDPTYIEPESCECNCPTEIICAQPAPGVCPFEPDDTWPIT